MASVVSSYPFFPHRHLGALAPPDADPHVVMLRGEHDYSTAPALSETLARAIAADDADLVVDLSRVQFMDASTVAVLVRAREFLGGRSRCFTLRAPSTCASRVLQLCSVDERTAVARSPAVACRAGP